MWIHKSYVTQIFSTFSHTYCIVLYCIHTLKSVLLTNVDISLNDDDNGEMYVFNYCVDLLLFIDNTRKSYMTDVLTLSMCSVFSVHLGVSKNEEIHIDGEHDKKSLQ